MKDLRGRTAIVTGASRGIGVYIAKALAERGVNLSLAARSIDELEVVRNQMEALGVRALATECDVTDGSARHRLVERTESELGPVDILVNNAGIETIGHFEQADDAATRELIEVNLTAPLLFTREVLPGMLDRGRGHVVQIASAAGKSGAPYLAAYSASKHGLVGLSHALRCEFQGQPVGFSVVCPAFVTEAGMYRRWQDKGINAPRMAGSSTPTRVAKAVVDCIVNDKAEAIINTPPLKPMIVLGVIAPGVVPRLVKAFGYTKTLRAGADLQGDR